MRNFLSRCFNNNSQYQELKGEQPEPGYMSKTCKYLKSIGWQLPALLLIDAGSASLSGYLLYLFSQKIDLQKDYSNTYYNQLISDSNQTCYDLLQKDVNAPCPPHTALSIINIAFEVVKTYQNSTQCCSDLSNSWCQEDSIRLWLGLGATFVLLPMILTPFCLKSIRQSYSDGRSQALFSGQTAQQIDEKKSTSLQFN